MTAIVLDFVGYARSRRGLCFVTPPVGSSRRGATVSRIGGDAPGVPVPRTIPVSNVHDIDRVAISAVPFDADPE